MFAKDNKRKRHANERMRTSFSNSGRIAGAGILYDDYSEESCGGYRNSVNIIVHTVSDYMTQEELKALNGPVNSYKIVKEGGGCDAGAQVEEVDERATIIPGYEC